MQPTRVSWRLDRRKLVAMIGGALLYGLLSWLTNLSALADTLGVDLRPAIAIPIIFGFVYGPIVGLFVGFAGNVLGDWVSWQAFYWNWSLGNGMMGLVPGLYALRWRSYRTFPQILMALLVSGVGIVVGMGIAAYLDVWICQEGGPVNVCAQIPVTIDFALNQEFIPVVKVNLINALILVPILLFNIERLDLTSRDWLRSGLLRRLLVAIVISAALPTAVLGFFLTQEFSGQDTANSNVTIKLILTIIVGLIFSIANAGLVAQSMSRPLLRLTGAARAMEAGELSSGQVAELKATEGNDEIAILSQVFGRMAEEVITREEKLRRQVEELRIEIDVVKQQKQVAEITDTDYFQELQRRAKALRRKEGGDGA
ncbi:MAG: hypothetical protein KatS3mg057_2103 [Herpetosiphonaceae bacterium]|nr:MAG: hypothetical protein KatS3mg057_2103 [Herpetosiphonaceae bacterium]